MSSCYFLEEDKPKPERNPLVKEKIRLLSQVLMLSMSFQS